MAYTSRQQQIMKTVNDLKNVHVSCKRNSTAIKNANKIIEKFNNLDNGAEIDFLSASDFDLTTAHQKVQLYIDGTPNSTITVPMP
jgi:hypothetical protein